MRRTWSVAEAKEKLSLLLREAQANPQMIENRGAETAVVVSAVYFAALEREAGAASPRERLQAWAKRPSPGGGFVETKREARKSPFED